MMSLALDRRSKGVSFVLLLVIAAACNLAAFAAGEVDPSFVASAVRTNGSNFENASIKTAVLQPDGKILIGGSFAAVGIYARKGIARLNADGTVDTTFNPPELDKYIYTPLVTADATIHGIGLQADGKIIIGGDFTRVDGVFEPVIIRLNADGSPDTAFNTSLHQNLTQWEGTIYDIEILPSGKILVAGDNISYLTQNYGRIVRSISRLNPDGTFDNSFGDSNTYFGMTLRKIVPRADGTVFVAGAGALGFNNVGLARLTENGFIDFTFTGVAVNTTQFNSGMVNDLEVLANGQIIIAGEFSFVNGFSYGRLARINSDGSVDVSFNTNNAGANAQITSVAFEVGGKMLISGSFSTFNNSPKTILARLNPDGTLDSSLSYSMTGTGTVNVIESTSGGKIFIGGEGGTWDRIQILNSNGTFPGLLDNLVGKTGWVRAIAQQPDGKILAGGRFVTASGVKRNNLARYNPDGTIDASFNPFVGPVSQFIVNKIVVQPDGKILVASQYTGLSRLNQDGTKDPAFTELITSSSNVTDVLLMPNGQILVFGAFVLSGNERRVARLNSNGTVSAIFPTNFGVNANIVRKAALQTDGKIVIGGDFTQVDGLNRGRIARINADGTHDATFNPPGGANGAVNDLAIQPDGKIVLVGEFDALNGSVTRKYVGRLNPDGALDTGFSQASDALLYSVKLQTDGKVLIGGIMYNVGGVPRRGIARLSSDGSVDGSFQVGSGTNNPVWAVGVQTDGKVLLGGEFSRINGYSRVSIARLLNPAVQIRSQFDYDGDGRADISVFRASTNRWYEFLSSTSTVAERTFGVSGDIVAPSDYDGDGKTDIGIFRPSTGDWWYLSSINGAQVQGHWGASGDVPRPSDFDGDGKADLVLYRPAENNWYRFGSTGAISIVNFGSAGDKPLVGDFDGDGKSDAAIFRPSSGEWWYRSSINAAQIATRWGISSDIPVPADYDGDGKTDLAVYRPSTGAWYVLNSGNGSASIAAFGLSDDKPVPADYDGDGKADIAVFRPGTGVWYLQRSTAGFTALQFGISTDIPTPGSFVP